MAIQLLLIEKLKICVYLSVGRQVFQQLIHSMTNI